MTRQIDHVGVVVADLEQAIRTYAKLGYEVRVRATIDGGKTQVAFVYPPHHDTALELMQPEPGVGPLGEFLRDKGPGVHHVAFRVDNLEEALQKAREEGFSPVQEPREGVGGSRVAYIGGHQGIMIQLVQR